MEKIKKKKNLVFTILCWIMVVFSLGLGFLIYAKKDQNAKFLKDNFNIVTDFTTLNENVNRVIKSLFTFGLVEKEKISNEETVGNEITYLSKGNNMFITDDKKINMLDSGIILGVYEEKDATSTIVISYDNGVIASYFYVIDNQVKVYDQLEKTDFIGTYNEEFKVLFKKDGKLLTLDEAFK